MDSARANGNSDQDRNLPPVSSQLLSRSDMKRQDTKTQTNTNKHKQTQTNKHICPFTTSIKIWYEDTRYKNKNKHKISNTNKRLNLPLHNFYQDLIQRDKIHQYKNRCNIDYVYKNDIFLNKFLELM